MKNDFNTENSELKNDENEAKRIIIFIFLVAIFWGVIAFFSRKKQKTELYEIYGVTDKTFKKWIIYFCNDAMKVEVWQRKRILTRNEFKAIQDCLGSPKPKKYYTKQDLFQAFGFKKYERLKWDIEDSLDKSKMSFPMEEVYNSLNKFPPKMKELIAKVII
jgi:hypothetical protein